MPITVSEDYTSRPFQLGRTGGIELIWSVIGTEDDSLVEAALRPPGGVAPSAYRGRMLDSIEADPLGGGVWKASAKYVQFENNDEYTFDTGGGTQNVRQSLLTVAAYARPGETAPEFHGAINVSKDSVDGVDITTRRYEWTETHYFDDALITGDYKRILFLLTGTVNDAAFKGTEAGESLFLGASGSKRGDERWGITYRFAAEPNVRGISIGGEGDGYYYGDDVVISGIDKDGWDYLWIQYADFVDNAAFCLVKRPVACMVERVYHRADFSLLGIGT